jgi:hypothetical protein
MSAEVSYKTHILVGCVMGYVFAVIWNWFHPKAVA